MLCAAAHCWGRYGREANVLSAQDEGWRASAPVQGYAGFCLHVHHVARASAHSAEYAHRRAGESGGERGDQCICRHADRPGRGLGSPIHASISGTVAKVATEQLPRAPPHPWWRSSPTARWRPTPRSSARVHHQGGVYLLRARFRHGGPGRCLVPHVVQDARSRGQELRVSRGQRHGVRALHHERLPPDDGAHRARRRRRVPHHRGARDSRRRHRRRG